MKVLNLVAGVVVSLSISGCGIQDAETAVDAYTTLSKIKNARDQTGSEAAPFVIQTVTESLIDAPKGNTYFLAYLYENCEYTFTDVDYSTYVTMFDYYNDYEYNPYYVGDDYVFEVQEDGYYSINIDAYEHDYITLYSECY